MNASAPIMKTPQHAGSVQWSHDASDQYDALNLIVRKRRGRLTDHPVYELIGNRTAMKTFMENHVRRVGLHVSFEGTAAWADLHDCTVVSDRECGCTCSH